VSERGLEREFASLGIRFDLWNGESSVDALIAPMIEDLKKRRLAEISEGALVVPVAREDDKKPLPPLLLIKSEGGVLYGTTDLATVIERVRAYDPDLILYVVDHRQHGHFEQVFRAAEKAQLSGNAKLEHVGYGTMNGADGKPFKTRAGGVMKLQDLIGMATAEAEKRLAEQGIGADYSADERGEIARKVGIATIKFADLSNHRTTDYIFDLERFSRFEGKTGPYLQYAAVRIQSMLRKARKQGADVGVPAIHSPEERKLILQLLSLGDALAGVEDKRAPNMLCEYAFELASGAPGWGSAPWCWRF
jgi:arginyl-tRNA synthetase